MYIHQNSAPLSKIPLHCELLYYFQNIFFYLLKLYIPCVSNLGRMEREGGGRVRVYAVLLGRGRESGVGGGTSAPAVWLSLSLSSLSQHSWIEVRRSTFG